MTIRVDAEDIEPTRSEKFLAVVLTAFLLVGAIWFYVQTDDWVGSRPQMTAGEQAAVNAHDEAQQRLWTAQEELDAARVEMEVAREDYNTALEAGEPTAELEADYRREQAELDSAQQALAGAEREAEQTGERAEEAHRAYADRADDPRNDWAVAAVRFVFVVAWLLASYWLLSRLRRRGSRYLPLGFAAVATGAITAVVFAADYITDYIDPLDLGPIVLSAVGAAATLAAFAGLQRYLAQRIPGRRVRRGECPFCGYPVRGDGPHCEGCGREVLADCATCGGSRRVGSTHCVACGAA